MLWATPPIGAMRYESICPSNQKAIKRLKVDSMKQKFFAAVGALVLGFSPVALGQPSQVWENWGQINVPSDTYPYAPQIDAVTFINHAGALFNISGISLFDTSDTLNYTNQGRMIGVPGFDFQTYPSAMGAPRMAANFANLVNGANGGLLSCNGSLFFGRFGSASLNFFLGNISGNAK